METAQMFSLRGRRALITGSGRGLGLRHAQALAGAGAEVVLNDVDPATLASAVTELRSTGVVVHGLRFNVAKQNEAHAALREFETAHGAIDILVNNAGIHRYAAL